MDTIIPISEVRSKLPELITGLSKQGQHLVITRHGRAAAVLISPEELETLEIKADKTLLLSIEKAQKDIQNNKLYSHKEVFKDV